MQALQEIEVERETTGLMEAEEMEVMQDKEMEEVVAATAVVLVELAATVVVLGELAEMGGDMVEEAVEAAELEDKEVLALLIMLL